MMNGLDKLIEAGNAIESRLIAIRESIDAELGPFTVNPKLKIFTGAELKKLAEGKQGEPIIIDGKFCIAYIKDNSYHSKDDHDRCVKEKTSNCFTDGNKVHFYYCRTICYMKDTKRYDRYAATYDIKNIQKIDLRDEKNLDTHLAWCKNCIGDLIKNGKINTWGFRLNYKQVMAESSHAQTLMDCVELLYNGNNNAKQKTVEFIEETIERARR